MKAQTVEEIGATITLLCAQARYKLTLAQAQLTRAQATLASMGAPEIASRPTQDV